MNRCTRTNPVANNDVAASGIVLELDDRSPTAPTTSACISATAATRTTPVRRSVPNFRNETPRSFRRKNTVAAANPIPPTSRTASMSPPRRALPAPMSAGMCRATMTIQKQRITTLAESREVLPRKNLSMVSVPKQATIADGVGCTNLPTPTCCTQLPCRAIRAMETTKHTLRVAYTRLSAAPTGICGIFRTARQKPWLRNCRASVWAAWTERADSQTGRDRSVRRFREREIEDAGTKNARRPNEPKRLVR